MKSTNDSGFERALHKKMTDTEKTRYSLLRLCIGIVSGLLLPQATVYGGFMPFGVGFAAAVSGGEVIPVFMAILIGYACQGVDTALRYMAALIAVIGIRWSVSGFKSITQTYAFPAVVAFLSTLITGSALVLSDKPGLLAVMMIFAESLLAGGFAYVATYFLKNNDLVSGQAFSLPTVFAGVAVLAVLIMPLFATEWGGISPGRILALLLILLAGWHGKISGGCLVGVFMGISLLMTAPDQIYFAEAYMLCGILSAVLSEKKKWITSVLTIGVILVMSLPLREEITVLISVYETLTAGVLFVLIPQKAENGIFERLQSKEPSPETVSVRQGAAFKLDCVAKAMAEVAGTVDAVSEQLSGIGSPEIGTAYRRAADRVCRTCKKKLSCWEGHFEEIMDSFNALTPILRSEEASDSQILSGYLKTECIHREQLFCHLVNGYREYTVREGAFRRLQALRSVVNDQFDGMAQLLKELSTQISEPEYADVKTEHKIREFFSAQHIALHSISCRINSKEGMFIEVLLDGQYHTKNKEAFRKKISELCGHSFSGPILEHVGGMTRVSFTERHAFRVAVGCSQLVCKGENLCGDAVELFEDGNGRYITVLSDGMGSGGGAAVDSAMAAGLAARMLKAGFGYESMLKMINTAIMAKSEDESLATLDIAVINLFTGDFELLKAGAGASLLLSRGRITYLSESSLPLGILHELTFAQTTDRLVDGDVLLIMSDGVSNGDMYWLENMMREYKGGADTPQELSVQIAKEAQKRQGEDGKDDVTVVVLQIEEI